jgi:hypothetical protein
MNPSRKNLDSALAEVRAAADQIKQADAGLERLDSSITADDVARELADWNARETESYAAVARGEIPEILDYAERADILKRLAVANAKRDAVERARADLRRTQSEAFVARDAAQNSIPLLSMQIAVDERLPLLIQATFDSYVAAAHATGALKAFRAVMLAQAYGVSEANRSAGLKILASATDRINAFRPNDLINVDDIETKARATESAFLADLTVQS